MSIQGRMIAMASVEALRRQGVDAETAMRLVWRNMLRAERAPRNKEEPKRITQVKAQKTEVKRPRAIALQRAETARAMVAADASRDQIAAATGLSLRGTDELLKRIGAKIKPARDVKIAERRAVVAAMHRDGKTTRQISDALAKHTSIIEHDLKALGLKCNPGGYSHTIAPEIHARRTKVAELTRAGLSKTKIAAAIGISRTLVGSDRDAIARNPSLYAEKRPESAQPARYPIRARETQDRTVATAQVAA